MTIKYELHKSKKPSALDRILSRLTKSEIVAPYKCIGRYSTSEELETAYQTELKKIRYLRELPVKVILSKL